MITPAQLREVILKSGFVSPADFDAATKTSEELGKGLTDVLAYQGLISEDILGKLVADYYHVSYINLHNKIIPSQVLTLIPEEAASTFRMLPFKLEGSEISLAMEDPEDLEGREFVKRKTGRRVKIFYISTADLSEALGQYKRNIKEIFQKIIDESILYGKRLIITLNKDGEPLLHPELSQMIISVMVITM